MLLSSPPLPNSISMSFILLSSMMMKSLTSALGFFGSEGLRAVLTAASEFEVVASYTVASLFVGDFICDERLW